MSSAARTTTTRHEVSDELWERMDEIIDKCEAAPQIHAENSRIVGQVLERVSKFYGGRVLPPRHRMTKSGLLEDIRFNDSMAKTEHAYILSYCTALLKKHEQLLSAHPMPWWQEFEWLLTWTNWYIDNAHRSFMSYNTYIERINLALSDWPGALPLLHAIDVAKLDASEREK